MPKRLYALEGSKIQFFFNATDPEGYPLHYNATVLEGNVWISRINQTQKMITIARTKSSRITLIIKESGGKEINHTIKIVALSWSCQNGGILLYIVYYVLQKLNVQHKIIFQVFVAHKLWNF